MWMCRKPYLGGGRWITPGILPFALRAAPLSRRVQIRSRRICRTGLSISVVLIHLHVDVPQAIPWWREVDYSGHPALRPPGRAAFASRSNSFQTNLSNRTFHFGGSHPPPCGCAASHTLVEGGGLLRASCPSPSGPRRFRVAFKFVPDEFVEQDFPFRWFSSTSMWMCRKPYLGGGRWIRTTEGVSQQIYSLPPLAAWVSLQHSSNFSVTTVAARGWVRSGNSLLRFRARRLRVAFRFRSRLISSNPRRPRSQISLASSEIGSLRPGTRMLLAAASGRRGNSRTATGRLELSFGTSTYRAGHWRWLIQPSDTEPRILTLRRATVKIHHGLIRVPWQSVSLSTGLLAPIAATRSHFPLSCQALPAADMCFNFKH